MLEHIPTLISQKDDARLAQVITKEEVVEVINDLEPNKIPTPNDFNIFNVDSERGKSFFFLEI